MKPEVYGFIPKEYLVDLEFSCILVVDPDKNYFKQHVVNDRNKYDKLILIHGCEPSTVNNIKKEILDHQKYFDKIFSFDEDVLSNCKNSELFCFGSCWVLDDDINKKTLNESDFVEKIFNKKFKVSFIKSPKNYLEGHRLRSQVPKIFNNKPFEVLHLENIPIKYPLFEDSMFHVTIENTRENNYFTEKIIDCFMTKTIPLYWGCPNIDKFFNPKGYITFSTIEELDEILSNLTVNDYHNRLSFIEENYKKAKKYAFFFERINNILLNNI